MWDPVLLALSGRHFIDDGGPGQAYTGKAQNAAYIPAVCIRSVD